MRFCMTVLISSVCIFQLTCQECLKCRENEILDKCKNPCQATCQKPRAPTCELWSCKPGCICQPGYLRDESTKLCVKPSKCSITCAANEEKNNKEEACEPTCQNYPTGKDCLLKPCICKPGFFRDLATGKCTALDKCPKVCGINEEWRECSDYSCRRSCQNIGQTLPCLKICKPGCSCKKGFIWNELTKTCILPDNCPTSIQCAPHEIRNCNKQQCESTCQNSLKCYNETKNCVCQPGYARDLNGKCIPADQCPKVCGKNEEWNICANPVCRRTCQNRFETKRICLSVCTPACDCKPGYIWDEITRKCILEKQCPPYACGINEEWKNCSHKHCRRSCQNIGQDLTCSLVCEPGCTCRDGFIWDEETRKCIPRSLCPKQCLPNEKNNDKKEYCEPSCQKQSSGLYCYFLPPKCICQSGYLRDVSTGKCVLAKECPKACGKNQEWKTCTNIACRRTCQNRFNKHRICTQPCEAGCECKEGYIWDEISKKCVLEDQCPSSTCGVNEKWTDCSDRYCRRSCQNIDRPLACLMRCQPGCSCKQGFIWNEETETCIPEGTCPKTCGVHEEWTDCSDKYCRRSCQNIDRPLTCLMRCQPGCSCKQGFIWNEETETCVPEGMCPKTCGINQEWRDCSDKYCRRSCQNIDRPLTCLMRCQPGCSCKQGFIWNEETETCVPEGMCPKTCGINQEWRDCSDKYCRRSCQNIDRPLTCLMRCQPGCSCKQGFIWNEETETCVPEGMCPKTCGINQQWTDCSDKYCRRSCQNIDRPLACRIRCQPGCSCKEGFIWNEETETCIPEGMCPRTCDINEEWTDCSDKYCRRSCQSRGQMLPCPLIACQPGCICKSGFIWNENIKMCIPHDQCPQRCGVNAEWSNVSCRETCQRRKPNMCNKRGRMGCACKDDFIWDEHTQRCVKRHQCSRICGNNQEWCTDVPDDAPTCQSLKNPSHNPYIIRFVKLRDGCFCKEGYVWDEISAECVLPQDCPQW